MLQRAEENIPDDIIFSIRISVALSNFEELDMYFNKFSRNINELLNNSITSLLSRSISNASSTKKDYEAFIKSFSCFVLLINNANPYETDTSYSCGHSPMHIAAILCKREIIWYLCTQGYIDRNTEKGNRFWILKNREQKPPIHYVEKDHRKNRLFLKLNTKYALYKNFITCTEKYNKDIMRQAYYHQRAGELLFKEAKEENLLEFYVSKILDHYCITLTTYNDHYSEVTGEHEEAYDEMLEHLDIIFSGEYSEQLMKAFKQKESVVSVYRKTFEDLKKKRIESRSSSSISESQESKAKYEPDLSSSESSTPDSDGQLYSTDEARSSSDSDEPEYSRGLRRRSSRIIDYFSNLFGDSRTDSSEFKSLIPKHIDPAINR